MIRAVVFDDEGVVLTGERFSMLQNEKHGLDPSIMIRFFSTKLHDALVGKSDIKEEFVNYLHNHGWQKPIDAFDRYWFDTEQKANKDIIAYVVSLRSRGIQCFLATNQEKHQVEFLRESMGLSAIFDHIFASCEMGVLKPEQDFFRQIMDFVGVFPREEVLYWDDIFSNVEKARNFGFRAEEYITFEDFQKKMAVYLDEK